ncbi:MAG TPA: hypothetical protein PL033_09805 [Candidatus Brocadiia bacterium]|nr:hypothetical protein [Candidatus Brocadiia bacterium]
MKGTAIFFGTPALRCALITPAEAETRAKSPTIVLAYDGSGDFGPGTPGTKTAGWQEALDHCVSAGHDIELSVGDEVIIECGKSCRLDIKPLKAR